MSLGHDFFCWAEALTMLQTGWEPDSGCMFGSWVGTCLLHPITRKGSSDFSLFSITSFFTSVCLLVLSFSSLLFLLFLFIAFVWLVYAESF